MDNERTITYDITCGHPLRMDHEYAHCSTIVQFNGFEPQVEGSTVYLMFGAPVNMMVPLTDELTVLIIRTYTKKPGNIKCQLLEARLAENSDDTYEYMRYSDIFHVIVTPSLAAASMVEVTDPRLDLMYMQMSEAYQRVLNHEYTAEQSATAAATSETNAAASATAAAASATEAAAILANKVDKVEGKGLSTNDYTTTEKTKLAGIAAGAGTAGSVVEATLSDELKKKVIKDYVTPEMFGAVGDGITDDTDAVQACLTAGKIVWMIGTYKINRTLTLHSNLDIYGFDKGQIIKDPAVVSPNHFASLSYYGDSISDVTIDGMTLVGLKYWTNQSLSGYNNDYGIRIKNGNNIKILNCAVSDCGGCAISVIGENIDLEKNTVTYTGDFSGNDPNYNFGIEYSGTYINICDNIISGVIQGIISGLTNSQAIIKGNNISTNGQHGLYMEGASDVLVTDNIIHDCTLCGVKFQRADDAGDFANISITDNHIIDCSAQGILIVDLSPNGARIQNVGISDNKIENVQRGIDVYNTDVLNITNNIIVGTSELTMTHGINITGSSEVDISDNFIKYIPSDYSSGGIVINETSRDDRTHDITIKANILDHASGVKFLYDYVIEKIIIDGNVFVSSTGSYNILFFYSKTANNAIISNNKCDKGLYFAAGVTAVKRCYSNVGIAYVDKFTVENNNDANSTINSQNCYIKGDSIFINIDFKLLSRGSLRKFFYVPVNDISLPVNQYFIFKPFTDDLIVEVIYTGTNLEVWLSAGTVDNRYRLNIVV